MVGFMETVSGSKVFKPGSYDNSVKSYNADLANENKNENTLYVDITTDPVTGEANNDLYYWVGTSTNGQYVQLNLTNAQINAICVLEEQSEPDPEEPEP